ncbi:MAG: glycosyltransferase family 2 protein [Alistipes sp.]
MNSNGSIRISVLIPVYGVERYIDVCVRSLFTQTLTEGIEFIFVDDASLDRSIELLEKNIAAHPARTAQVRILHHDHNRGLAAARRTAIDAARGEWILHVDSDDVLLPHAAEQLLTAADTQLDTDLVFGDYFETDDPTNTAKKHVVRTPNWSRERLLRVLLTQSHRITNRTWGILIRRALCTQHAIYPVEGINFAEDYAVMPRLLHAARHVTTLHTEVYGYRLASDGSYMKRINAYAATQYIAANKVVTDYLKQHTDYESLRKSVVLGRLNIEKWLLKRGLQPQDYDAQLFADSDRPHPLLHRIYAAAIRSRITFAARVAGVLANFGA